MSFIKHKKAIIFINKLNDDYRLSKSTIYECGKCQKMARNAH